MVDQSHSDHEYCKILFYLEQDEDDWPPADVESLWAKPLENGLYEIANTPFFVRGLGLADIVRVSVEHDALVFEEVVEYAGHITIRIIFYDSKIQNTVEEFLTNHGCSWEGSLIDGMIAVDIPPEVNYPDIQEYLVKYEFEEKLEYEEGCIPDES